jgi:serine/threonine-protein kinase
MSLAPGTRVGHYEIVGSLGAGGMGEVYRARDARLQRDVAIKVLPLAVAGDPERRARFEREARTLAALNHPHIAQIHGLEDSAAEDGLEHRALVMELVEGPTLATLIEQGPMPVPDAIAIASQIADALEAAHDQGIVHRDLKPANVKVRPDGTVKVLDFGLAKALGAGAGDSAVGLANSPTVMATGRTEAGIILGTAAYMAPEQARGRSVDKRADIWAFGCVLFEMLTGRPAFAGETTTDILAEVVQRDPDWTRLPGDVPAPIAALLRRTLQKNPRERLRDIGDARIELTSAPAHAPAHSGVVPAPPVAPSSPPRRRAGPALLFVAGALAAAAATWLVSSRRPDVVREVPPVRSIVSLPQDTTLWLARGSSVALSPDGRQLAYVGRTNKIVRLFRRSLDRFESVPLAGTEDAANPFFSPDGKWIGFFASGKLKKIALEGGAPVTLADARAPRGEAWLPDDSILMTAANNLGVLRVPARGGAPEPFTVLGAGELSHRWPRPVPGGTAVLFSIWNDTGWEPSRIAVQRLGEREHHVIVESGGYPRAVVDAGTGRGYLVYARAEGLLAAPFDVQSLTVTGPSVPIVDDVVTNLSGGAHFDIAAGTLVYVPGTLGEGERTLDWVTPDGQATPARKIQNMGQFFWTSPDGTRILRNNAVGNRDVWIEDLTRGVSTRVTSSSENFGAVLSPDNQWIAFARGAPIRNLYRRSLTQGALDERLTTSANWQEPAAISPDRTKLVYEEIDPASSVDLWVMDLPRPGTPIGSASLPAKPFLKTTFNESNAALSADGQWLAYQSNESGRFEIYVRAFPGGGPAHQVSTEGGIFPAWSRDQLFYRAVDGVMVGVPVVPGAEFKIGAPRRMFDVTRYDNSYGVMPDGKRFLMLERTDVVQAPTAVALVQNFLAELRQRVK